MEVEDPAGVGDCREGGLTSAAMHTRACLHHTHQIRPLIVVHGEGEDGQREGTGEEFADETVQLSVRLLHPG